MNDHLKTLKILLAAEQFKIEHNKGEKRVEEALSFAISAIERSRWVAVEVGEKPDAVDFQTEYLVSVDGDNGNKFVCLATYDEGHGWRDVQTDGYNESTYIETDYGPVTAYQQFPEPYTPKEQL